MISQGLVILYLPILFDVLTKQDDTGENTLKFDFISSNLLRSWQLNFSFFLIFSFFLSCPWRWLFVGSLLIVTFLREAGPHRSLICVDFYKALFKNIFWPFTYRELSVGFLSVLEINQWMKKLSKQQLMVLFFFFFFSWESHLHPLAQLWCIRWICWC